MVSRLSDLIDSYRVSMIDIFNDELIRVYLTGSIALSDYIEDKSDADFTVLLKSPLNIGKLEPLNTVHHNTA